jgi:hypothetical protein
MQHHVVVITRIGVCRQPVSFIALLREATGCGLASAKQRFEAILDGRELRVPCASIDDARLLAERVRSLGGTCEVE